MGWRIIKLALTPNHLFYPCKDKQKKYHFQHLARKKCQNPVFFTFFLTSSTLIINFRVIARISWYILLTKNTPFWNVLTYKIFPGNLIQKTSLPHFFCALLSRRHKFCRKSLENTKIILIFASSYWFHSGGSTNLYKIGAKIRPYYIQKTLQRHYLRFLKFSQSFYGSEGDSTEEVSTLVDCISIFHMSIVGKWKEIHIFLTWGFSLLFTYLSGRCEKPQKAGKQSVESSRLFYTMFSPIWSEKALNNH